MYTVLLVDDEELSRFAFKTLVSRYFNNIRILAEAENGSEALVLYRQFKPDIVIMDIRMPGMSGLDTLRQLFREFPQANVLICSAYDSFTYVTQALDLGVKGYLLKPVTRQDLEDKLQKIADAGKAAATSGQTLGDQTALKMLLSGAYSDSISDDLKQVYGSCIRQGLLVCLAGPESVLGDMLQTLRQAIRDVVPDDSCSLSGIVGDRVVYYLAAPEKSIRDSAQLADKQIQAIDAPEHKDEIPGTGEAATKSQLALDYAGDESLLSWSEQINENALQEFPTASVQAQIAIADGNWREAWKKINENKTGNYTLHPNAGLLRLKILDKLRVSDQEAIRELADEWLSIVMNLPDPIRMLEIVKLLLLMNHTLEKLGIETDYSSFNRIVQGEIAWDQTDMLEFATRQHLSLVLDSLQVNISRRGDLLQRIDLILIEQPLADITLNSIAVDLGISSQYLCRTFKEETGKTFLEYLTSRRLETAAELLRGTDCPVKDIAQLCGYQDTVYFARLFKRNTGLTPSDYRSRSES